MTDRYESRATTHAPGCWDWGPRHYGCAVREIERLRAEVAESYVQMVPDKCDRIVWRGSYYHLPIAAPAPQQPAADKFVATFRCESNGIVGLRRAPIHSVSMHDDGIIEVVIDHWPEPPTVQLAAISEEILVNAAHDVYILPLQPSGLSSGPRFVVHVPQPEAKAMPDWDAAPPGATHYQPRQGAYYKRVSALEWYVWDRVEDREMMRWLLAPGTSDSAEWIVRPTEALAKHQPCGCVICTCEDEKQCQGCGAKHCGNRTDHPAYVKQQPEAQAVAWARPVYAKPVGAPEAVEGEMVDVEFHLRAERPEGEGWRPLVFASPFPPAQTQHLD